MIRVREFARLVWPVAAPVLLCGLVALLMQEPLRWWLYGEEIYDEQAMVEWLRESRIGFKTLPDLLRELADSARQRSARLRLGPDESSKGAHEQKRAEIQEMLKAMAAPPTKIYPGQLPLFPIIFRLEVGFDETLTRRFDPQLNFNVLVWDSDQRRRSRFRRLKRDDLVGVPGVYVQA